MRHSILIRIFVLIVLLTCIPFAVGFAEEKATAKDVYALILKAVPVMEQLGEEGLEAFKDPKGEFVYQDAYVLVLNCKTMQIAAHLNPKLIGLDLTDSKDKNPDPAKVKYHGREMCENGKNKNGGWLEYYWNKIGSEEVARKIGFALGVPGTDWVLVSSIYDDETDIGPLNDSLK